MLVWDELLDRRVEIAPIVEGLNSGFDGVRDITPPRPEPHEIYMSEIEFLKSIEGVPQISLKELALENQSIAPDTGSQAVVIGGDLFFPPEGGENAEEWRIAGGEISGDRPVTSEEQVAGSLDSADTIREISTLTSESPDAIPPGINDSIPDFPLLSQPSPKYQGRIKNLVEDLRSRVKAGESIIFVVPTSGKLDRLREILKDYEISYEEVMEESRSSSPTCRCPFSRERS